jgi:integrase/recombinase XerD
VWPVFHMVYYIRFIQQMLGHAKLTTTQLYTHVSISQLKAIHTATHPAAGLRGACPSRSSEGEAAAPGATPADADPAE